MQNPQVAFGQTNIVARDATLTPPEMITRRRNHAVDQVSRAARAVAFAMMHQHIDRERTGYVPMRGADAPAVRQIATATARRCFQHATHEANSTDPERGP